jgi:ribosomal protein L21
MPKSKTKTKKDTKKKTKAKKAPASKSGKAEKTESKKLGPKKVVLEINGMQYIVNEGETINTRISLDTVDNKKKDGTAKDLDVKLLAIIDEKNEKLEYGKPYIDKTIDYEIGDVVKGEKITTSFFRAKSRYRRKTGMRKKFVQFTLNKIK